MTTDRISIIATMVAAAALLGAISVAAVAGMNLNLASICCLGVSRLFSIPFRSANKFDVLYLCGSLVVCVGASQLGSLGIGIYSVLILVTGWLMLVAKRTNDFPVASVGRVSEDRQ